MRHLTRPILLLVNLVLCVAMYAWNDGDTILVSWDKEKMLLTDQYEVASPNLGFTLSPKGDIRGIVHIVSDSMYIDYFAADEHIKTETYLIIGDNEITMAGKQLYYKNDILFCEDFVRKGLLTMTTWFDKNGKKDRVFIYSNNRPAIQYQYYPSGKKKMKIDYQNNSSKVFYDQSGVETASFQDASPLIGMDEFVAFFNRKFRANRLYSKENLLTSITIDSLGNCSMWIFDTDANRLYPFDSEKMPQWKPATIDNQSVQYTFCRSIDYNPIEYCNTNDTFPVFNLRTTYNTYNGIQWSYSRIYSITPADTCSNYGVVTINEDSIILTAYNKKNGNKICRQSYVENDYGNKIKEGWFIYYDNNKITYQELYKNDSVVQTVHFYDNEQPKTIFDGKMGAFQWDKMTEYYKGGGVKWINISVSKDSTQTQYYDKQGNPTTDVQFPAYPKGSKGINKYVRANLQLRNTKFWKNKNWTYIKGWEDYYVEIDADGKLLNVGKGGGSCSYNCKNKIKLQKWDFDNLYDAIQECLRSNPTIWIPGTINGEPTSMRTKITVHFEYERN